MYTVRRIKAVLHLPNVCALLTAITVSLFICGCTDNGLVSESPFPEENSAAVISLNIKQQTSDLVRTRAVDENVISNLYILAYNGNGSLIGYRFLSSYTQGQPIVMDVNSGINCTIYAIANLGSTPVLNAQTANTESALKAMMCGPVTTLDGVTVNNQLIMSGSKTGVTLLSGGTTNLIGTITISRLVAKSIFTVTTIPGINITGYSIKNLPKYEYLVARPNPNESLAEDIAVGDDAQVNERFDTPTIPISSINNLTFYMFENRRGGRAVVDGNTGTSSDQKEKRKYAPDYATYLEVYATGTPSSSDLNARFISATYRIFLGADNSLNYNVKRNCSYNYIVNITSATDIDTRVTKVSSPSNCYMVKPNNYVIFPVFTVNENKQRVAIGSNWTAELLWTDKSNYLTPSGTVKTITAQLTDGTILVETGSEEGNAVVVAKVNGVIVWSWHIWVTSYDPNTTNLSYNNGTRTTVFMNRNLGAINNISQSVGSLGLVYQWGRKDPFPGASGITSLINTNIYGPLNPLFQKIIAPNTRDLQHPDLTLPLNNIDSSIKNPLLFYFTTSTTGGANKYDWYSTTGEHDDNLWGATGSKSVYDPSPEGWRVPTSGTNALSPWNGITKPVTFSNGYNWTSIGWYPATGYLDYNSGSLMNVGIYGIYWSASVKDETDTYSLYLSSAVVRTSNLKATDNNKGTYRSYGFPIRCVKE